MSASEQPRWERENPEKRRAQRRRHAIRHADERAAYYRAYRERNRERIREQDRARYRANREDRLAYARLYRQARLEYWRAYDREHRRVYGPDRPPTCRGCGVVIEWGGRGRPKERCPACRYAAAFLRWHRRRGCDLYDDWGAWLRTHRCDAAAVWRIVRDEVASEGVAGEDVWAMDDREAA